MRNFLIRKGKESHLFAVYNPRDDQGRARLCAMLSMIVQMMVSNLSGSLFYTGFLMKYGMDISRIGILVSIPSITCLFSFFSPVILERFRRRKRILFAGKFAYYFINILGITLLPMVVRDNDARLVCFVVLVFLANIINQLVMPGFNAWRANFLPNNVRVDFFSSANCITYAVANVISLLISSIGDRFTGTEYELTVLTAIRLLAFALAVIDCLIWLIPKEWEYISQARIHLGNALTLPLKNKKFLLTMLLLAGYNFASGLTASTLNVYLLEKVEISYTLNAGIDATFFLFFLVLSAPWKRFIKKKNWIPSFGYVALFVGLSYVIQAFVTKETIGFYVVARIAQHIMGVPLVICQESLLYVHLPTVDRTNYLSFHTILINCSVFLSRMVGTLFTGWYGERVLKIGSLSFVSTQILLFGSAALFILVSCACFGLAGTLSVNEEKEALQ